MNPIRRFLQPATAAAARAVQPVARLFGANTPIPSFKTLPNPKPPPSAGVAQRPEQSNAAGLVSDFAIDKFAESLIRLPDPDDVLRRAGLQRHDLRRLEFDDEISGALETRRDAAVSSDWRIDDGNQEQSSPEVEFVEGEIRAIFQSAMAGLWNAVPYGYAVSEAVYATREDGRVGFARLAVKPMQWFEPMRDGRLVMHTRGDGTHVELDTRFKFCLLTRNATYGNPFGEALLSRLYWPWFFRHAGWKAWMQFVDRFGDPFVVTKSGNPADLVSALLGMGVKNVIGVGSDDDINVLMQNGDATFDRLDARLTERILKTILGQTLTSGSAAGGGGSYALGKVHDAVRQDKRMADTRLLTVAGQWMVNALWAINRFAGQPPKFMFPDPKTVDLQAVERDVSLKGAGMATFSKEYLLRTHGYKEGDIEVPDPADVAAAAAAAAGAAGGAVPPGVPGGAAKPGKTPPKPGKPGSKGLALGAAPSSDGPGDEHTPRAKGRQQFTPEQEAVERLAESAMDNAPESPISVEDMRLAILGAKDKEDLEARLATLIDRQSADFAETLERAIFAADILGYVHAAES